MTSSHFLNCCNKKALSLSYGYIKSPDNAIRHEQELSATLTEQQKIILEIIKDNHTKLMSLGERDAFCRGFSLAVRLMIDSMSDKT
ncbi:DUF6809 family protein [Ruminococcus sp. YE282]|uniref:DUF6809 family protein n=1 Tax=Ruminococcus sp. YE282 TaxID=3158780 RepID=UPI00338FF68C